MCFPPTFTRLSLSTIAEYFACTACRNIVETSAITRRWCTSKAAWNSHKMAHKQESLTLGSGNVYNLGVPCMQLFPGWSQAKPYRFKDISNCLEVVNPIPAGSTIITWFFCGFICISLCQSMKIKPTNMYIARARAQLKKLTHNRCCDWHLCIPDGLSIVQCCLKHVIHIWEN